MGLCLQEKDKGTRTHRYSSHFPVFPYYLKLSFFRVPRVIALGLLVSL